MCNVSSPHVSLSSQSLLVMSSVKIAEELSALGDILRINCRLMILDPASQETPLPVLRATFRVRSVNTAEGEPSVGFNATTHRDKMMF